MPLITKQSGDCRGTEKDGSKSDEWCSLCYTGGKFVDPDCTLTEMIEIVDRALIDNGSGRVFRWMAKRQVPRLARWRARRDSNP